MIIKSYEFGHGQFQKNDLFLIYGENQGLKEEIINKISVNNKNTIKYFENEILQNETSILETFFTKSLFENEKIIIVNKVTDKFNKLIEGIEEKKIDGIKIILNADILEKKSKLRSIFEKQKNLICVPVYNDNEKTLQNITITFFKEKKIPYSIELLNFIISKSGGDRKNLKNELNKIGIYCENKNKITIEEIKKLINLSENHSHNELVDACLAKNQKKLENILNNNLFIKEDYITIIRIFLIKAKRILLLHNSFKNNEDIDDLISKYRPPIFWKDKEIVKRQFKSWAYKDLKNLIDEINEIELMIKKNTDTAKHILLNFIFSVSKN